MSNRVCGPKPTKQNNAYTKDELIQKAVDFELLSLKDARKKSMKELCETLNISYTDPLRTLPGNNYEKCIKYVSKKDLLEQYKDVLNQKGISYDQAKNLKKNKLCDIIYTEEVPFEVPLTFDRSDCDKYDLPSLERIAIRKNIDITTIKTKNELCDRISLHYLRENLTYDSTKNPYWTDSEEDFKCMIPLSSDKVLKNHQISVVKHMLTHRGLLAVHATGTGKTLTAVTAISCMMNKYPNLRIIILTPLSLVENFKKELKVFGILLQNILNYPRIDVYSYDEFVNLHKRKREIDCSNTFLIIDEAHNFRSSSKLNKVNTDSIEKGSKAYIIMQCASQAFKVLLLTATPLINSISDIQNLLMMINGEDPSTSLKETEFKKIATESLESLIHCKISYYVPDLSEDYPKRIDHIQEFIMTDDYYKKYKEIETKTAGPELVSMFGMSILDKDYFYHNLRMAVNALDEENNPKINWIVDLIVKEAQEGRKSIVFSNWKKAGMNLIRKRLDQLNIPDLYLYISGQVPSDVRRLIRKKYNKNKTKILLITRAGGEGLDLKETRNIIIMESNWNPSIDQQIIGRGVRYKSHSKLPEEERTVNVYKLILKKPEHALEDKIKSVDEVLHDLSYNVKEPMFKNIYDTMSEYSIEKLNCNCEIGNKSDVEGCQILKIPEQYVDPSKLEVLSKEESFINNNKTIEYEAPSGLTSLAIHVDEVSAHIFKRLAGIKDILKQKRRKRIEYEIEEDEDIKMEDDLHVEYDPPQTEIDKNVEGELEEENLPEIGNLNINEDEERDFEDIELVDDL